MVLSAGLEVSGLAGGWVERPSVNELLDRAAQLRVCVVIGAAGWGKTAAVSAWSRHRPTVWLRYEDHEADADRLLAGFFGALRAHVAVPGPILATAALNTRTAGRPGCPNLQQPVLRPHRSLNIQLRHFP